MHFHFMSFFWKSSKGNKSTIMDFWEPKFWEAAFFTHIYQNIQKWKKSKFQTISTCLVFTDIWLLSKSKRKYQINENNCWKFRSFLDICYQGHIKIKLNGQGIISKAYYQGCFLKKKLFLRPYFDYNFTFGVSTPHK